MFHPPTCIIRHRRENLKKCSLRGLEQKEGFSFFLYPHCVLGKQSLPDLSGYCLLDMDGPELSPDDQMMGLVLIDATWRLAEKMVEQIKILETIPKRRIPSGFTTAYPRRQEDCKDPQVGLASIEALFIAYSVMGRNPEGLFDNYHWKEPFLKQNQHLLKN